MRKHGKPLLFGSGNDRLDTRPRGVSGATITSWDRPKEIDPDALFSRPGDQVSLAGAASTSVSADSQAVADAHQDGRLIFVTPDHFPTVAII
jgi:hypothetical protein